MVEFAQIAQIITKYAPQASQLVVKEAQKRETIVKVLKQLGWSQTEIPDDVDTVYAYALVEYGVFKPEAILNLLREKEIKDYFWKAYTNNSPFQFLENTKKFLKEHRKLKKEIENYTIDLCAELEEFGEVFISAFKGTTSKRPYPDWD